MRNEVAMSEITPDRVNQISEIRLMKNTHQKMLYLPPTLNYLIDDKARSINVKPNALIKEALIFYMQNDWGNTTPNDLSNEDVEIRLRALINEKASAILRYVG